MGICKDFGRGFTRLWERIHKDCMGIPARIRKILGEDFIRIHGDSLRICKTLGEDL